MPFPLLTTGTARTAPRVRLITGDLFQKIVRVTASPLQWNPHEVNRWQITAPGFKLLKPAVLIDGQTPGGGGSGPVVPTTGQIWPRGNR